MTSDEIRRLADRIAARLAKWPKWKRNAARRGLLTHDQDTE